MLSYVPSPFFYFSDTYLASLFLSAFGELDFILDISEKVLRLRELALDCNLKPAESEVLEIAEILENMDLETALNLFPQFDYLSV